MQVQNFQNTLTRLNTQFTSQQTLGPGAHQETEGDSDFIALVGATMLAETFEQQDNQPGIDLDPEAGKVKFSAETLGGLPDGQKEIVGSYRIERDQEAIPSRIEVRYEALGDKSVGTQALITRDLSQIVVLEDLGQDYKATAFRMEVGKDPIKEVLQSPWQS